MTAVDLVPPPPSGGLAQVPAAEHPQRPADFTSDQEVRWCPGCGDYAVLSAVQAFLPTLGLRKENIVFVSGIGCSSRFPYYLDTHGLHSIHGRAPAIATGLAVARPDLSIWVATGDGDALSIGGNHLIHTLRRNVNLKILLFNNRVYGLTKGQASPTSNLGMVTKATPAGALDTPFNPVSLALGAEASFVGRALDSDRAGLTEVLTAAAQHRGTALVEIYQNCPVFNAGAFDVLKDRQAPDRLLALRQGMPITFGARRPDGLGELGVYRRGHGGLEVARLEDRGVGDVVVHDARQEDPLDAFALSRLSTQDLTRVVTGVFRAVSRPTYDDQVRERTAASTVSNLDSLLHGTDTWTSEPTREESA